MAFGYFAFYIPYSALIKAITTGILPGIRGPISGFALLPSTVIATATVMLLFITGMGWWQHAGRRQVFGLSIPCPDRWTFVSGLGFAMIIGTTTLAYAFRGVSIVFALLLLRGGVLIIAPIIDMVFKRKVRWFSWMALALSLAALVIALADVKSYTLTLIAVLNTGVYLSGYLFRLPCMTKSAKCGDGQATYRYFVEEQMVAMPTLVIVPAIFAMVGAGSEMMDLRHGFLTFFSSAITLPGLAVGFFYACLAICGTLIYLDRRENTFCIPLNRCSSLLSGVAAAYALTFLFGQKPPGMPQLVGAGLVVTAIILLSPLHHLQFYLGKVGRVLGINSVGVAPALSASDGRLLQRLFLFVCSGNTSRSPMAEWICKAEIAERLNLSFEASLNDGEGARVRAMSAGISARDGAPMTANAQQALQHLGTSAAPHAARNLTPELVQQAEVIYCMTEAQRQEVIANFPAAAAKIECLDTQGDIADPSGSELGAFIKCAELLQRLIRSRLDAAALTVAA